MLLQGTATLTRCQPLSSAVIALRSLSFSIEFDKNRVEGDEFLGSEEMYS